MFNENFEAVKISLKKWEKKQRNAFSVYYSILQLRVTIIYILCDFW